MIDSAWKSWYKAKHDQRCQASGEAFEIYVTELLSRFHSDFVNPSPMGSYGDGGCDGLADSGAIFYACYGQRATTGIDQKTKQKLESDFARALECWDDFTNWRFVTNASVGPAPMKSLQALRKQHGPHTARPITIDLWKTDDLWQKVAAKLTLEQLDEVIPGVPHVGHVELADLVDLIQSLEQVDGSFPDNNAPIRPVPSTKMNFNKLPETTRAEFNVGRLLSVRIDRWFSQQSDPTMRDEKAQRFRAIYQEARRTTTDVREIVRRVYGALGGQDFDLSTKRANAVYAVTAYFFDSCDIFEEPPDTYDGSEVAYVVAN
ncbi:hypothetical protein QP415_01550 [Pauljensenia sp. UMB3104]|uniref:ABC-three component system protein n=1 Tax=Pauljensenia sp. UMB3104 TaxID=3046331 RepID=UPI00254B82B4|nr:ABC-three component system protein [Pauljensenia sp. UMB3104]MDK7158540.1 hypothetical protein [Pauljensenia sp. UMB3104]